MMGKCQSFRNRLVHVCPQSGLLLLLLPAKAPAFAFAGKVYHVALSYSSLINWRLPKMAISLTSFHYKEVIFVQHIFCPKTQPIVLVVSSCPSPRWWCHDGGGVLDLVSTKAWICHISSHTSLVRFNLRAHPVCQTFSAVVVVLDQTFHSNNSHWPGLHPHSDDNTVCSSRRRKSFHLCLSLLFDKLQIEVS